MHTAQASEIPPPPRIYTHFRHTQSPLFPPTLHFTRSHPSPPHHLPHPPTPTPPPPIPLFLPTHCRNNTLPPPPITRYLPHPLPPFTNRHLPPTLSDRLTSPTTQLLPSHTTLALPPIQHFTLAYPLPSHVTRHLPPHPTLAPPPPPTLWIRPLLFPKHPLRPYPAPHTNPTPLHTLPPGPLSYTTSPPLLHNTTQPNTSLPAYANLQYLPPAQTMYNPYLEMLVGGHQQAIRDIMQDLQQQRSIIISCLQTKCNLSTYNPRYQPPKGPRFHSWSQRKENTCRPEQPTILRNQTNTAGCQTDVDIEVPSRVDGKRRNLARVSDFVSWDEACRVPRHKITHECKIPPLSIHE